MSAASGSPRRGAPSFWQLDAPAPAWPALDRDQDADVLVVGAGLSGLGVARALRARGRSVLVLDALGPGGGASGRNAGFLLRTHVTAFPALAQRVGEPVARAWLALAQDSHARVAAMAAAVGALHRRAGSLMLAASEPERALLAEARDAMLARDVRAEHAEVPAALRGYVAALLLPDDGEIHPMRLLSGLAAGVAGRRATVERIDPAAHVVVAGARRVTYRALVLATNAWTSALAPSLRITPARAQMLATAPVPHALALPCYARRGFDYFRQLDDGRVLVGGLRDAFASAESTDDPDPSAEVQAALDALVREHLPFAAGAPIERRWAGTMGFTATELPYVGALGDDVFSIAGFTGHGLGTALGCAELCAADVVGEEWPARAAVLRAALSPRRA